MSTRLYGPNSATSVLGTPPNALSTIATNFAPLPVKTAVAGTAETVVLNPAPAIAVPLVVQIPANSKLEQVPFLLKASGYITTAGAANVTVKLYSGVSATVANDVLLGSSGPIAQNNFSAPWFLELKGIYDSVSGKLAGTVSFFVNNTLVGTVAVSNVVTGVSGAANPVASFLLSFTFSAAFANAVNVQEFAVYTG